MSLNRRRSEEIAGGGQSTLARGTCMATGRARIVFVSCLLIGATASARFTRCDVNLDGTHDIGDAVTALLCLFQGRQPACADVVDCNNDKAVDLADPIYLLSYLFAEGPAPRDPHGVCRVHLTTETRGLGGVTLDPPPPYWLYDRVTLRAETIPGWRFSRWSGDLGGAGNPVTIELERDTAVEAVFVVPRGSRLLGIDVTAPADDDYHGALLRSQAAGSDVVSLSLPWDEIEVAPGRYENPFLEIANAYFPSQGIIVTLVIAPIDTNNDRRPSDLKTKPFDDPQAMARFQGVLEYVFSQIPALRLSCLSIGNEVDSSLGLNATRWGQYRAFFRAGKAYVRSRRPELAVGAKITFDGLTGPASGFARQLNEETDVVLTTYYPLQPDFTVKDPGVVNEDFATVGSLYPDRSILFLELGYPSSPTSRSSQAKQAEFIRQTFQAWDLHAAQIPLISFTWLNDISPEALEFFRTYYGLSDPRFLAFLGSLGLRTYAGSGTDKQAFTQLSLEAAAREW
jgi:hypothetical protein